MKLRHGVAGTLARALFLVVAAPILVRASLRAALLYRRLPLDEVVARLRRTSPLRLRVLARPRWLAGAVAFAAPLLPPWGLGPCLKQSLLLVDLWARCGLEPILHLAVERRGGGGRGHAWVSAGELATSSQGFAEAFRF